MAQNRSPEATE